MKIFLLLCFLSLVACQAIGLGGNESAAVEPDGLSVDEVMDGWHQAASEADAVRYMGYMADESVFLGTDPSERWTKLEFASYVEHYFTDEGRGWTYVPSERTVAFDSNDEIAWFDERLENAGYGVLRGTGVMRRLPGGWRIVHYSMTFAIPNDAVEGMVGLLGLGAVAPEGGGGE